MKYNDLKSVYVESYLDTMIGNGRVCLQDSHCNVQQCKSACDIKAQKCMEKQVNNNLQIVCDKVSDFCSIQLAIRFQYLAFFAMFYLFQLFHGTPHWPGLLNSNRTPKSLQLILDDCINPQDYVSQQSMRRFSTPVEIRERLYDELTRVYEEALSNSGF